MKVPLVRGTIDRRLLVNFAVDPEVAAKLLPSPFRPKIVHDHAVAGICLIRLRQVRPKGFPASFGVTSENAAHRIAVTWDDGSLEKEGVFIPRRDTSSRLTTLIGGRIFPGASHFANFEAHETERNYRVELRSRDGATYVSVSGHVADALPPESIFSSLEDVSSFFKEGSIGYSATADGEKLDGLELKTYTWQPRPFEVEEVHSSFFDDASLFPPGTRRFDNALIMNRIDHEWHALRPLRVSVDHSAA